MRTFRRSDTLLHHMRTVHPDVDRLAKQTTLMHQGDQLGLRGGVTPSGSRGRRNVETFNEDPDEDRAPSQQSGWRPVLQTQPFAQQFQIIAEVERDSREARPEQQQQQQQPMLAPEPQGYARFPPQMHPGHMQQSQRPHNDDFNHRVQSQLAGRSHQAQRSTPAQRPMIQPSAYRPQQTQQHPMQPRLQRPRHTQPRASGTSRPSPANLLSRGPALPARHGLPSMPSDSPQGGQALSQGLALTLPGIHVSAVPQSARGARYPAQAGTQSEAELLLRAQEQRHFWEEQDRIARQRLHERQTSHQRSNANAFRNGSGVHVMAREELERFPPPPPPQ